MKTRLTALLLTFTLFAAANDSIFIRMNKIRFNPGDTLSFSCQVANYKTLGLENATMNVWIEDIDQTALWKFRYPIMNGRSERTKLVISDSLKPGIYAMNFVIQPGLFSLYGKNRDNRLSTLNYFVLPREGGSFLKTIPITKEGEFSIENIIFDNEAAFVFSPSKSKEENNLFIDITNPLDSPFIPVAVLTQFIAVGTDQQVTLERSYEFNWEAAREKGMLPHVTVVSKQKTRVQQFNEEYASPFFRQDDNHSRWFNGFEDPQLSKTANLENFLVSRVPGFRREMDFHTHSFRHFIRGNALISEAANIFFNEMPVPAEFDINTIIPSDIALIKVVYPPTMINPMGNGAAILIYTKRGSQFSDPNVRNNFVFKGYTPPLSNWK